MFWINFLKMESVLSERIVLSKILAGSKLFGTDRPESDTDYMGVFVPSRSELLRLENPPNEWTLGSKVSGERRNTKEDTDFTLYSVRRFLDEVCSGQSQKLELLFAPKDKWVESHPGWDLLVGHRQSFLSKRSVAPFLGFALKQAYKATIKGAHLTLIRELLFASMKVLPSMKGPLRNHLSFSNHDADGNPAPGSAYFLSIELPFHKNDQGFCMIRVGGREYDIGKPTTEFLKSLRHLEMRYGDRVNAVADSSKGFDYKSVLHCMRQLAEAEELLTTGFITLPRPPKEIEFLMSIRAEQWPLVSPDEFLSDVKARIAHIENEVMPKSVLPKLPDRALASEICVRLNEYSLK